MTREPSYGWLTSPRERALRRMVQLWMRRNGRSEHIHCNLRPEWLTSPHSKAKLELDIFIPKLRTAFECNGYTYHKGDPRAEQRDDWKKYTCQRRGIKLYRVWSHNFNTHQGFRKLYDNIDAWLSLAARRKGERQRKPDPQQPSRKERTLQQWQALTPYELTDNDRRYLEQRLHDLQRGHVKPSGAQEIKRIKARLGLDLTT